MSSHKSGVKIIGNYELTDVLGRGAYATVRRARHIKEDQIYAIKIIAKDNDLSKKQLKHIRTEIVVMRLVDHPHIVKLKEILASKSKIYIVMEFISGCDLLQALSKHDFSPDRIRLFFTQVIAALEYCQRCGICHRDLKPENILINRDYSSIKITDFGLSALHLDTAMDVTSKETVRTIDSNDAVGFDSNGNMISSENAKNMLLTACGSPHYVAPEVLAKKGYDGSRSDVWSAGILLYLMLCRALPFHGQNLEELFSNVNLGKFNFPTTRPSYVTDDAKDLIARMLQLDPVTRPTFTEILMHPYLNKNKDDMRKILEYNERLAKEVVKRARDLLINVGEGQNDQDDRDEPDVEEKQLKQED